MDKAHFQECAIDMLTGMFGEESVGKFVKSDKININVSDVEAVVNFVTLVRLSKVTCFNYYVVSRFHES